MRLMQIIQNNYYHIIGRGNNKMNIFLNKKNYARFLFSTLYFQSPISFTNIERNVNSFLKDGHFNIQPEISDNIISNRYVELVNFTLVPNHFHLTIFQKEDGGISKYMQRVLTSYSKYHNKKYDAVGHTFQGPFKAVLIRDDNQLSYTSAYIHKNSNELLEWRGKEHLYPWSSFQDYVGDNRWGELLKNEIIMQKFETGKDYKEFVIKSGAKETLKYI